MSAFCVVPYPSLTCDKKHKVGLRLHTSVGHFTRWYETKKQRAKDKRQIAKNPTWKIEYMVDIE